MGTHWALSVYHIPTWTPWVSEPSASLHPPHEPARFFAVLDLGPGVPEHRGESYYGLYWGYIGVILEIYRGSVGDIWRIYGKYIGVTWGYIGVILEIFWDNGKEWTSAASFILESANGCNVRRTDAQGPSNSTKL